MTARLRILTLALLATAAALPASAQTYRHGRLMPETTPVAPAADAKAAADSVDAMTSDTIPGADEMLSAGPADAKAQSLQDALRWSYQNNPTIRAGRDQLLATQENLPQAEAGWKPTAAINANANRNWIRGDNGADGSFEKSASADIDQPLYRGGRTESAVKSAKNAIMAQRGFLIQTEQDTLLSVVTSYMNVLRDQSLLDLAVNNRDVIAKQLDATRAQFNVGDVTRTDVAQAEARLADAESGRVEAQGNLRASLAVYQQTTGLPPGRLTFPRIKLPIPNTLDESIAMAEDFNPTVIAAQFLQNAADADIRTVFGELLPQIDLTGSVGKTFDPSPGDLPNQSATAIGVTATIPLYEAGSVRSRVRAAKDIASQRRMELQEAQSQARQATVTSWEALQAARAEIQSRTAEVQANRVARNGVHKEAELGTRTILDALNADQELLTAQSDLVTARRNEVVSLFQLADTLGLLTPKVLGFPELEKDYNQHIREITGKVFSMETDFGKNDPDPAPAPGPLDPK